MMQEMTDEQVIEMARKRFPVDRPMSQKRADDHWLVRDLCDRLQKRLDALKPPARSWEGVWGEFDARERAKGNGHAQVTE